MSGLFHVILPPSISPYTEWGKIFLEFFFFFIIIIIISFCYGKQERGRDSLASELMRNRAE